ncbi:GNAT family N-acetyltransferase [Paenibacillus rigui]|uniref:GNAT family N-acetyltransferase n=1 Tax=Paenibacillus rigui TaxID=554312 RepID=A0A229UXK9_9BACL|nr:GNAT family N-acetyltransferase [Paenibacillus rigui]OXM87689.1 GNAT family N-acetyltransferase [Paenibacillus rigui]
MDIRQISKEAAWTLRHQVMWPEKPLEYVKLRDDDQGTHWGFYAEDRLVSVLSLFIERNRAQFRKFATLPEEQGKGFGTRLLRHVMDEARRHGADQIRCNARADKAAFYKRFGLIATNQAFEKDGISYVIMETPVSGNNKEETS